MAAHIQIAKEDGREGGSEEDGVMQIIRLGRGRGRESANGGTAKSGGHSSLPLAEGRSIFAFVFFICCLESFT